MVESSNSTTASGNLGTLPPPADESKPTWMKRLQKRKQAVRPAAPEFPIVIEPNRSDEPLPLSRRIMLYLGSATALGLLQSVIFHIAILATLSLFVFELANENIFSTVVSTTDSEELADLQDLPQASLDISPGVKIQTELQAPPITEVLNSDVKALSATVENEVSRRVFAETSEADPSDGNTGNIGFMSPPSDNIVRKGNFTAWTVPKDPKPGEDYNIIIHIKVPERINRYRVTDLGGFVQGTDNYRQNIPNYFWKRKKYLPMKDHVAQLVVSVPGADELVRDTIQIRSRILKEEQTLEIEF